jgi:hypothetical protein
LWEVGLEEGPFGAEEGVVEEGVVSPAEVAGLSPLDPRPSHPLLLVGFASGADASFDPPPTNPVLVLGLVRSAGVSGCGAEEEGRVDTIFKLDFGVIALLPGPGPLNPLEDPKVLGADAGPAVEGRTGSEILVFEIGLIDAVEGRAERAFGVLGADGGRETVTTFERASRKVEVEFVLGFLNIPLNFFDPFDPFVAELPVVSAVVVDVEEEVEEVGCKPNRAGGSSL